MSSDPTDNIEETLETPADDSPAAAELSPIAPPQPPPPPTLLERVNEYRESALRRPDALQACLGVMNAGLLEIAHHLEQQIVPALAASSGDFETDATPPAALETLLRVARQSDRYSQIELRLAEARQRAEELELRFHAAASRRFAPEPNRPRNLNRRGPW